MIVKPTVFVLGAGASQPYGFPSGAKLVDRVCRELIGYEGEKITRAAGGEKLGARLRGLGHQVDEIVWFATELGMARRYSIDRFLEMRREFLNVGKAAIADVLLDAEHDYRYVDPVEHDPARPEPLSATDRDWYRYLFDQLIRKDPNYFEQQARLLSIVTFNFDRSFEHSLESALATNYGKSGSELESLVRRLKIVHVHGSLGRTDFGGTDDRLGDLRQAGAEIKIIHEEANTEEAKALLCEARQICFLGFGYDDENLQKLDVRESLKGKREVHGTFFGKQNAEIQAALRLFPERRITPFPGDALAFLRTVSVILD